MKNKKAKEIYNKYKSDWEVEQERQMANALDREEAGALEFGYGVAELLNHVGIKYKYNRSFAKLATKVRNKKA